MQLKYRPDIDGMRAIAILSVILFHAQIPGFSGGFVGVDVFFVISGFLITSILVQDRARDDFSLRRFYANRILRILPILCVVLATVSIAAFVFLPEFQFHWFSREVLAGSAFIANIAFYRMGSGYFTHANESNPLIHLWSLSIEEQFYLLFPLLLILLFPFLRKKLWRALAVLAVLSFVACELALRKEGQTVFYLPHYRAGELLVGALVATIPFPLSRRWQEELGSALGLLLIAGCLFEFNVATTFPGLNALFPCAGAALLIWGGMAKSGESNRVNRLLTSRVAVFIGLISYSLYLWHWPILVFANLAAWREPTVVERLGLLTASGLLSVATWKWIERPCRKLTGPARARGLAIISCSVLALAVLANHSRKPDSFIALRQAEMAKGIKREAPKYPWCDGKICPFDGDHERPEIAVWGDSHARVLADGVGTLARESQVPWVLISKGGCPPLLDTRVNTPGNPNDCEVRPERTLKYIDAHPSIREVILTGRWAVYSEGSVNTKGRLYQQLCDKEGCPTTSEENRKVFRRAFRRTVEALKSRGKKVTIVGPIPEMGVKILNVMRPAQILGWEVPPIVTRKQFEERQKYVLPVLESFVGEADVRVLYPHEVLCRENCEYAKNGVPLYYDANHLQASAAVSLWRKIYPQTDLGLR